MKSTKSITNIRLCECKDSPYIKPKSMFFCENGKERKWDIIQAHDSVAVFLYHKQKESFVVVKQFRPAVYLKEMANNTQVEIGWTYELCAGITDKTDKTLKQIAQEEILEECGYNVPLEEIYKVTEFYSSVGFAGSKQTLFFAQIDENYRVSDGGGVDDENIEVIFIPKSQAYSFIFNESYPKTSGVMFAFLWFLKRSFMNHSYALQEITKKLETIKESWQIYEIFEAEKKRFNEEYQSLQKDKEELIQTFNEVSAKNALLKVQNNELEEKNKALENALKEKLHLLESSQEILKLEKSNPKIDFSLIKVHLNTLGNLLSQAKVDLPPKPIVLKKLEISYQKRKKLLAAPANDYVSLQEAMELFYLLEQLLEQIQAITLEYSKINSEIAYQENRENGS